jgi:hypothetical protein
MSNLATEIEMAHFVNNQLFSEFRKRNQQLHSLYLTTTFSEMPEYRARALDR